MARRYFSLLVLVMLLMFSLAITISEAQTATVAPTAVGGGTFTGTNWAGQFYNTADLTGAVVATALFQNGLNKNWGAAPPTDGAGATIAGVNADNWSARFSTTAQIGAGLYQFALTADDGARVFIDGNLILDNFANNGLIGQVATVSLAGGTYTLIVDYNDKTGNAVLQLSWFLGGGTAVPTATPAPIATGQVTGVRGLALRSGPYKGASLINVARPGKDYPMLARNLSEGIYTWYLIQYGEPPQTGWVSGRYLTITGEPTILPIIGTLYDQIDAAADTGVIGTTRSVMNMRIRPSERTLRILQVPWGDQVRIVGRTVQDGKSFWYHVVYQGQVGWILAAYVTVRGDLNRVPVR